MLIGDGTRAIGFGGYDLFDHNNTFLITQYFVFDMTTTGGPVSTTPATGYEWSAYLGESGGDYFFAMSGFGTAPGGMAPGGSGRIFIHKTPVAGGAITQEKELWAVTDEFVPMRAVASDVATGTLFAGDDSGRIFKGDWDSLPNLGALTLIGTIPSSNRIYSLVPIEILGTASLLFSTMDSELFSVDLTTDTLSTPISHGFTAGLVGDGNRVNRMSVSEDNLYFMASGAILEPEFFSVCDFKNQVLPPLATACVPCSTELEWGINETDCTTNDPNSKFLLWETELDEALSSTQSAVITILVSGASEAEFNINVKAEYLIEAMNFKTSTNSDRITGIEAVSESYAEGKILLKYKLPFSENSGLASSKLIIQFKANLAPVITPNGQTKFINDPNTDLVATPSQQQIKLVRL
jgi:hypothetical protein